MSEQEAGLLQGHLSAEIVKREAAESALAAAVAQAETLRQAASDFRAATEQREALLQEWRYEGKGEKRPEVIQRNRDTAKAMRDTAAALDAALSVSPSQGRVLTDDECEQVAVVLDEAATYFAVHDLERTDGRMSPIRHRIDQALRLLVPARAGGKATA